MILRRFGQPLSWVSHRHHFPQTLTKAVSEFYKIGHLVEVLDTEDGESVGDWFEGPIARVTNLESEGVVAGCDDLTY